MSLTNDGKHVANIIASVDCKKHKAPTGMPCWQVPFGTGPENSLAVCGKRIRSAGFNGKITANSIKTRSSRRRDETDKTQSR